MTRQLPRIAATLLCDPWLIRTQVHRELVSQFRAHLSRPEPQNLGILPAGPDQKTNTLQILGHLGVIGVHGIIGRHLDGLETMCGGVDISETQKQLRAAQANDNVEIVVMDFRSPGGVATGVHELAKVIREVAAEKPVLAYVNGDACSAAYYLAAACDSIVADPAAYVGSISTILALVDDTRAWEMEGLELKLFRSGSLKGIGISGKEITEEESAHLEERVMNIDLEFKTFIRDRRGLSDQQMQGQTWLAKEVSGDLVDGFAENLEEFLASLQ